MEISRKQAVRFVDLARGPNDRLARKAIAFPFLYGPNPKRLAEALGISEDTAKYLIKDYESTFKVTLSE